MRRGVDRDNFFVDHVRYGTDNRAVAVIEGPGVVIDEKKQNKRGYLRQCAGKTGGTHHARHLVTTCGCCHAAKEQLR